MTSGLRGDHLSGRELPACRDLPLGGRAVAGICRNGIDPSARGISPWRNFSRRLTPQRRGVADGVSANHLGDREFITCGRARRVRRVCRQCRQDSQSRSSRLKTWLAPLPGCRHACAVRSGPGEQPGLQTRRHGGRPSAECHLQHLPVASGWLTGGYLRGRGCHG